MKRAVETGGSDKAVVRLPGRVPTVPAGTSSAGDPRIVTLLTADAYDPKIRARQAENAVSTVFRPSFSVEDVAPEFRGTRLGKRLERSFGLITGGLLRGIRVLEVHTSQESPTFVDAETLVKQMTARLKKSQESSQVTQKPDSDICFSDMVTSAQNALSKLSTYFVGEDKAIAKNNMTEGLTMVLRGFGQLQALETVFSLPEAKIASTDVLNNAWTLAQLGASQEEVASYLKKQPKQEVVTVVDQLVRGKGLVDKHDMRPDYVVTVTDTVSAHDLEQIAAYALPGGMLENMLTGNELAHIHVFRRGLNHFTLTLDTVSVGGEQRNHQTIHIGGDIERSYVIPNADAYMGSDRQADELFGLVRTLGKHIDFTKPDGRDRLHSTVINLASQLGWNPTKMYRDSFGRHIRDVDTNHYLLPLQEGTPLQTTTKALYGQNFDRTYTMKIDGQPVAKTSGVHLEGAYAYLQRNHELVWQLALAQEGKRAYAVPVAESLPGRRLPLDTYPQFTDPAAATEYARTHDGGYVGSEDGKTFFVAPKWFGDLPTEPHPTLVVEKPEPQTRRQRALAFLAPLL
jgi:hypothetical protein